MNNGYINEQQFVNYLNGKKIKQLNPLYLDMMNKLFENISEESIIKSWRNPFLQKTDIYIKINDNIKRISIKCGNKNSVHVEPISEFIHFLIDNKIERKYIMSYLKYHYADGTTNGSGTNRLSAAEYKIKYQEEIDILNKRFNQNDIIGKVIDRFILKGNNDINYIDLLIYGIPEDFIYITREEIKEIIQNKINIYSTGVHFSVLSCQPLNRCLNNNQKYDSRRYCVQIKWYSLFDDIIEYKNNKVCS